MSAPQSPVIITPGIKHPALVNAFVANVQGKPAGEILNDLVTISRFPGEDSCDLLIDLILHYLENGQEPLGLATIPLLAAALPDEESHKRAGIRLLVNRQFQIAVCLMQELIRLHGNTVALSQWLENTLRYFYRYQVARLTETQKNDPHLLLEAFRSSAAAIGDAPEGIALYLLESPRLSREHALPDIGYQSEQIDIAPPYTFSPESGLVFAAHLPITGKSQGFGLLQAATVIGSRSTIFHGAQQICDDSLSNMSDSEFSPFGMESAYIGVVYGLCTHASGQRHVVARQPAPAQRIPCGIFLNGPYQYNYFHWLSEYLSLVSYLNEASDYADWPLLISSEALSHPNHLHALELVSAGHQWRVQILEKDKAYVVDKLLLPPKVSRVTLCHSRVESEPQDYAFSGDAIRRLHQALAIGGKKPWRRIFLGRKSNDRLLNQDEIRELLERAGFQTIYPEDLSFAEARVLFGEAQIIVGPTGAAFTNLLLCPPGTTAILLTTDQGARAGFFSALAGPLNQSVIYLSGPGSMPNQTLSPFAIPTETLQALLAHISAP